MKMKFALLFLPALMALTSCGVASKPAVNKAFLEDTTAQSAIFGNNDVLGGQLQIKNRDKGGAISAPTIGYQLNYNSGTDMLAIRFVAAIKEFNVKAYWRRGVAGADGTELRSKSFANDGKEVTKYYTSLSDGSETITAGEGKYADYEGFVVYSIYNIPYTANKDAYVAAYVNLIGDEDGDSEVHNNSMALAVKIEKKTNYISNNVFAFDPTITGYFLEGTINGVLYDGGANGLYRESGGTPGTDHAWYDNVTLQKTDSFGSFYYQHDSKFKFFGFDSFSDGTDYFKNSSSSGFNVPKQNGTYDIHVSNDGSHEYHLFANASSIEAGTTFTIRLKKGCKWDVEGARFAIRFYNNSTKAETWESMTAKDTYYELSGYNPNSYDMIIICRMNGSDAENKWGNKWNQSRDLFLGDLAGLVSYFVLASGDPWDNNSNDYFSVSNV